MIEVTKLTKSYGPKVAIHDVSFEVKKGEILGFLGPNGAGKSTTMRILSGFLPASSGEAVVAGYEISKNPLEVRKRIGYLPENVPLYPEMTARELLDFSASLKGLNGSRKLSQMDKVMSQCGIADVANQLIGKLSKGYRQRVGLALALVSDPEVLILDEPTVGLDPRQIIEIRELIKGLAGEHTVILSTHILPEVSMTCQRVIIISEGRIVASDTPLNLTKQLQKSAKIFLQIEGSGAEVLKTLSQVRGVLEANLQQPPEENPFLASYLVEAGQEEDIRSALAAAVVKNGHKLLEMRPVGMTLEDIFIKLVTEEKAVEK